MCVCILSSDPSHPLFWHKCLPNEEQMESPQKFKYFSKNVYEQKGRPQRN